MPNFTADISVFKTAMFNGPSVAQKVSKVKSGDCRLRLASSERQQ
jgi:hypothetical protein